MDSLYEIIMADHSRVHADLISDLVVRKPSLLKELLDITFLNEEPVSRRASWPIRIISERKPELYNPYIGEIVEAVTSIKSVPIQRSLLALLIYVEVPDEYHGELLQLTSEILIDKGSPVAHIIYSADIFYKLSINEPDLLKELVIMLQEQMPYGTPGVKSKCRKITKLVSTKHGISL